MATEKFCLRWNDFESNIREGIEYLTASFADFLTGKNSVSVNLSDKTGRMCIILFLPNKRQAFDPINLKVSYPVGRKNERNYNKI